jgi:DnaJ-class molecular chaperone
MARIHTHYDNLKVARNAPPEVIRAAYKTLSQKYHPDRNGNSAEAIRVIQIINSAYAVLSDPVKRREHDEWIAREEAESHAHGGGNVNSAEFTSTHHTARRTSRHSRRRTPFDFLMPRHRHSHPVLSAVHSVVQKAWLAFDHLSRKLFRKI